MKDKKQQKLRAKIARLEAKLPPEPEPVVPKTVNRFLGHDITLRLERVAVAGLIRDRERGCGWKPYDEELDPSDVSEDGTRLEFRVGERVVITAVRLLFATRGYHPDGSAMDTIEFTAHLDARDLTEVSVRNGHAVTIRLDVVGPRLEPVYETLLVDDVPELRTYGPRSFGS